MLAQQGANSGELRVVKQIKKKDIVVSRKILVVLNFTRAKKFETRNLYISFGIVFRVVLVLLLPSSTCLFVESLLIFLTSSITLALSEYRIQSLYNHRRNYDATTRSHVCLDIPICN